MINVWFFLNQMYKVTLWCVSCCLHIHFQDILIYGKIQFMWIVYVLDWLKVKLAILIYDIVYYVW